MRKMRARSTKVCRWCSQVLPEWSDVWPHNPGIYLFYGYPINIEVDKEPRFIMVTVERYSDTFGTIWRTPRTTLKPRTGAAGYWMPLVVPPELPPEQDMIAIGEESRNKWRHTRTKRLNKRTTRRLK